MSVVGLLISVIPDGWGDVFEGLWTGSIRDAESEEPILADEPSADFNRMMPDMLHQVYDRGSYGSLFVPKEIETAAQQQCLDIPDVPFDFNDPMRGVDASELAQIFLAAGARALTSEPGDLTGDVSGRVLSAAIAQLDRATIRD